eukprot:GILI01053508.1.p1 GENE.GILI01053508.1~~GILI01053508.1.p1  ORF type:complete len:119 (-),score=13.76 GILI01053508.1:246-602(-)
MSTLLQEYSSLKALAVSVSSGNNSRTRYDLPMTDSDALCCINSASLPDGEYLLNFILNGCLLLHRGIRLEISQGKPNLPKKKKPRYYFFYRKSYSLRRPRLKKNLDLSSADNEVRTEE